jgi:hypothetical protein
VRQALLWDDAGPDPTPSERAAAVGLGVEAVIRAAWVLALRPPAKRAESEARALRRLAARLEKRAKATRGEARKVREEAVAELRERAALLDVADEGLAARAGAVRAETEARRLERAEFEAADRVRARKGGKA